MSRYIISEKAISDLKGIWSYTVKKWSVEQADKYYNIILDNIEYVVDNYHMTIDFGSIKEGYKYSKVKSHLIFFKKTEGDLIEVIRILHERMDLPNRLDD